MRNVLRFTLIAAALTACVEKRTEPPPLRGVGLGTPIPRPSFTLTATDGKPFAFKERTAGKLTLLFFGYTNCPDVCPVHAANVAAVIKTLPWEDRQKIQFVFVTTDPDRDSLPAIRKWLDNFDSAFIGLRGSLEEVSAVERSLNIGLAIIPFDPKAADGSYGVSHPAVVVAFEPNDTATTMYPFGIRQEDWAHDLPILLTRTRK
jgi:protein SCO1/2